MNYDYSEPMPYEDTYVFSAEEEEEPDFDDERPKKPKRDRESRNAVPSALQQYSNELKNIPVMTEEEFIVEHDIYLRSPKGSAARKAAQDKIIMGNARLVLDIAFREMRQRSSKVLELGDIIQAGNMGMMTALEKYDRTKGAKFATYATNWIRKAIQNEMANNLMDTRIPAGQFSQLGSYTAKYERMRNELSRNPTKEEMMEVTSYSKNKVEQLDLYRTAGYGLSLNQTIRNGSNPGGIAGETELIETLEDDVLSTEDLVENKVLREKIMRIAEAKFTPNALFIFRKRFAEDERLSFADIGACLGMSGETARKICMKCVAAITDLIDKNPEKTETTE